MEDSYTELLDATIRHLEDLKARGVSFVPIQNETLAALGKPAPNAAAPGPAPAPAPIQQQTRPAPAGPHVVTAAPPAAQPGSPREYVLKTPNSPGTPPATTILSTAAPESNQPAPQGSKAQAFEQLRERILRCGKCAHLVAARRNVVFGVGNMNAELLFVGEAPGADEDAQGEPFVGAAGQLLTKIIQAMGLRRQDVYIANILKCRPDTPGQSSGNRKPTPGEMAACISHLHEQIDLVNPRVLVALGATAIEGLLGANQGITKMRGNWQTYRNLPLMPTYHPAYLLRNQSMAVKRQVWEDMLLVMERLGMPISEKQRNYFK